MGKKVIIIGAVAAGMSAASKMKRLDSSIEVVVYTDESYISYAACGLPYFISGFTPSVEDLVARTVEEFAEAGITVHIQHRVTKIIPEEKKVLIQTDFGEFYDVYDNLLIATGSRARKMDIFGLDLSGVYCLRTIPEGIGIKESIARGAKNAVIVGGGYIGIEMVEALQFLGLSITLVEAGSQVLSTLDPDMAEIVAAYLKNSGVELLLEEKVLGFSGTEKVDTVVTEKRSIPADLVILTLGSEPNSEIAQACGIELSALKGIRVNSRMETNLPDIYAAGDCTAVYHRLYGCDAYIPLGTTANKQGKVAGANIAGKQEEFGGVVGTSITKVIEMGISRTGLSTKEAIALGYNVVEQVIKARDIAGYYPIAKRVYVKLIADRSSHKILGAQLLGEGHFAKRIDVMAAAVQLGMTVEELAGADLAYSPPFAPVWDPYLLAANRLLEKFEKFKEE